MPDIQMKRSCLPQKRNDSNARLVLFKGFEKWPEKRENKKDRKGQAFVEHLSAVCSIPAPSLYEKAVERIRKEYNSAGDQVRLWQGVVEGKLMMGGGAASVLETGITLCKTWGVPRIPGSALKGICRVYAGALGLSGDAFQDIFGDEKPEIGVGRIIFHDAWWLPGSAATPLVRDIVTPHHGEYFRTSGKTPPSEMDEPSPSPQIAARGAFLFAVEGDAKMAKFTMDLLKRALEWRGVGAKTAVGYGYFKEWDGNKVGALLSVSGFATGERVLSGHNAGSRQAKPEKKEYKGLDTYLEELHGDIPKFASVVKKLWKGKYKNTSLKESPEKIKKKIKEKYGSEIESWSDETKKTNLGKRDAYRAYTEGKDCE